MRARSVGQGISFAATHGTESGEERACGAGTCVGARHLGNGLVVGGRGSESGWNWTGSSRGITAFGWILGWLLDGIHDIINGV